MLWMPGSPRAWLETSLTRGTATGMATGQRPDRLSAHNLALLRRLQAAEGQPYTVIATHVLQNDHVRR